MPQFAALVVLGTAIPHMWLYSTAWIHGRAHKGKSTMQYLRPTVMAFIVLCHDYSGSKVSKYQNCNFTTEMAIQFPMYCVQFAPLETQCCIGTWQGSEGKEHHATFEAYCGNVYCMLRCQMLETPEK